MRFSQLLPLLFAPALLAGCNTGFSIGQITIGSPIHGPSITLQGRYDTVILQTESAAPTVSAQVQRATLTVGTRTYAGTLSTTLVNTYAWSTQRPCQDLPQGDALPASYALLDADQQVVQSGRMTLNIHTCR